MTASESNRYAPFFSSDNNLCSPVLQKEKLYAILAYTEQRANQIGGAGGAPQISLDLEHLQVADYAAFQPLRSEQQEAIRRIRNEAPIRVQDMTYLALRSLIGFHWEEPKSEDEVRRAAAYELALQLVLTEVSEATAEGLERTDAQLPYWGRLAFLRVMATIPEEQIESSGLSSIGCTLLKSPVFNARSFEYRDHGLIGLNFALEPILKGLNRMLLHFFSTQHLSGPRRMERALSSLIPVVAYFWAQTPVRAYKLWPLHALFSKEMAFHAHALTASQIDFIVRHELGHLVLKHGTRMQGRPASKETTALKHEFEFAADTFAQGSLRSSLYMQLRQELQWTASDKTPLERADTALTTLLNHQREVTGVRLLFQYMKVIDDLGRLMKARLGAPIMFRSNVDTHPSPADRVSQLDALHIGEHAPTSQVLRYAESFFEDVLTYAQSVEETVLTNALADIF